MRYLTLNEVLYLHKQIIKKSGGSLGLHNLSALKSALAQTRQTFGGMELYPTLIEKAAILGFLLIKNHPFIDGNKRVGHAAMELFLLMNGYEIEALIDEQEKIILQAAKGELDKDAFTHWLSTHIKENSAK